MLLLVHSLPASSIAGPYPKPMSAPELFIPATVLGAITGTYIYYLVYGLEEIGIKGGKQGLGGIFK